MYLRLSFFALCSIFAFVVFIGVHRDPPAPKARTVSILKNLAGAVAVCEREKGRPIMDQLLERKSDAKSWKECLQDIMLSQREALMLPDEFIPTLFFDGWGTPINVDIVTNVLSGIEMNGNQSDPRGLIVWSNGPNKTNNFTKEDDVVWPR